MSFQRQPSNIPWTIPPRLPAEHTAHELLVNYSTSSTGIAARPISQT